MISVTGAFTCDNQQFCHLLILSLKYMARYYSRITFSFKYTVDTKIMIWSSAVIMSFCIDLFHIFIQTRNEKILSIK